jgi:hypothetical protein
MSHSYFIITYFYTGRWRIYRTNERRRKSMMGSITFYFVHFYYPLYQKNLAIAIQYAYARYHTQYRSCKKTFVVCLFTHDCHDHGIDDCRCGINKSAEFGHLSLMRSWELNLYTRESRDSWNHCFWTQNYARNIKTIYSAWRLVLLLLLPTYLHLISIGRLKNW